jgi:hypothetical protein
LFPSGSITGGRSTAADARKVATRRVRRSLRRAGIASWIAFYNFRRPHQALANRTPLAVWRDGVIGGLTDTAVDMMPRLDNADALPAYPQPPQQQLISERAAPLLDAAQTLTSGGRMDEGISEPGGEQQTQGLGSLA